MRVVVDGSVRREEHTEVTDPADAAGSGHWGRCRDRRLCHHRRVDTSKRVEHVGEQSRVVLDGRAVSVLDYADMDDSWDFSHTFTDPAYRGRGLAAEVVAAALVAARRKGITVIPSCPYVRTYLAAHPDEADLMRR